MLINVKNTNRPKDAGTMIVPEINQQERKPGSIIGIAGKVGFSVIMIEKTLMDNEIGFIRDVCQVIADNGINIEHIPGGIDTLSVIMESRKLDAKSEKVLEELQAKCKPDMISLEKNMAMVCIVGSAIAKTPGVAAKIFKATASVGVNVRMINQGSSEISVIIGIDEKDYEATVRAIYKEFMG